MKERPITFSGEMVRAILDGRKTQTRRVIKPQPEHVWGFGVRHDDPEYFSAHVRYSGGHQPDPWIHCPYGKPGDRLWVRETFAYSFQGLDCIYKADDYHGIFAFEGPWKPSIFMPCWASRITLEITGVRVERLVDITDSDCYAEGITSLQNDILGEPYYSYKELWDSINAKRGYLFASNPWVWVIEFKRITP
jgi:hypothetical protein